MELFGFVVLIKFAIVKFVLIGKYAEWLLSTKCSQYQKSIKDHGVKRKQLVDYLFYYLNTIGSVPNAKQNAKQTFLTENGGKVRGFHTKPNYLYAHALNK